jgi:hypothetical protein
MKLSPIEFHSSVIGVTAEKKLLMALTDKVGVGQPECVALLICSKEAGLALWKSLGSALEEMSEQ